MPLPMGRTGPGLYGKAPVFRGLGTHSCFSVAAELHLGQAGTSSPKTRSSNLLPQAVQTKSYMGMVFLLNRCHKVAVAALTRNKCALFYMHVWARSGWAFARSGAGRVPRRGWPGACPHALCAYISIYTVKARAVFCRPADVQQLVITTALTGSYPLGGTYEKNSCACWRLC